MEYAVIEAEDGHNAIMGLERGLQCRMLVHT